MWRQFLAWCLCELNDMKVYVEGQRGRPGTFFAVVVDSSEMTNLIGSIRLQWSDDAMLRGSPRVIWIREGSIMLACWLGSCVGGWPTWEDRSIWVSQIEPEIPFSFSISSSKKNGLINQLSNGLHLHEQPTSSAFQIVNLLQKGAV